MAAGAGIIAGGIADLADKNNWIWDYWDNPESRYYIDQGQPPVAGPILIVAGSALLNVGLSEFITANKALKGSASIKAGAVPGGLAMRVSF